MNELIQWLRGKPGLGFTPAYIANTIEALQSSLSAAEKERDEAIAIAAALPENAADIRAFIGSNFCALEYGQPDEAPSENDVYVVSGHDLLSCFMELHDNAPAALSHLRQQIIERCAKVCDSAAGSPHDRTAKMLAAAIRRLAEEAKEQEGKDESA